MQKHEAFFSHSRRKTVKNHEQMCISQNLLVCSQFHTSEATVDTLDVLMGNTSKPGEAGKREQGKTCLCGTRWRRTESGNDWFGDRS